MYKVKEIQSVVRDDFKKNKGIYQTMNLQIPMQSKILHIGNDLGQIDILLVARSMERKITSVMLEERNYVIAKNCLTSQTRNVKYVKNTQVTNLQLFDALIISDKNALELISLNEISDFKTVLLINSCVSKIKFIEKNNNSVEAYFSEIRDFLKEE